MNSTEKKAFFYKLGRAIALQSFLEVYLLGIKENSKFLKFFSFEDRDNLNFFEEQLFGEVKDKLKKLSCKLEEYSSEEEAFEDLDWIQKRHQLINDFVINKIEVMRRKMTPWEKIEFFFKSTFSRNKKEENNVIGCH